MEVVDLLVDENNKDITQFITQDSKS